MELSFTFEDALKPVDQAPEFPLWCDIHKPTAMKQVCAQTDAIKAVRAWTISPKKPLLIWGPSGVGKHTIARLAANEINLDIVEIEADGLPMILPEVRKSAKRPTVIFSNENHNIPGIIRVRMLPVADGALYYWLLKRFPSNSCRAATAIARGDVRRALNEIQAHCTDTKRSSLEFEPVPLDCVFDLYIPPLAVTKEFYKVAQLIIRVSECDIARLPYYGRLGDRLSRVPPGSGDAKRAKFRSREHMEITLHHSKRHQVSASHAC